MPGSPSWRAALRIARRDAWRNKGRNALVALLVALPVMVFSWYDVIVQTGSPSTQDEVTLTLGRRGQALLAYGGPGRVWQDVPGRSVSGENSNLERPANPGAAATEHVIAAALPAGDRLVAERSWWLAPRLRVGDRAFTAEWHELDLADPGLAGVVDVIEGRAAAAPGEVVVTRTLAAAAGLKVGDDVGVPAAAREAGAAQGRQSLRVVGLARTPGDPSSTRVYGRPGTLLPAGPTLDPAADIQRSWYVVGPRRITWGDVLQLNAVGVTAYSRAVLLDPPPADQIPTDPAVVYPPAGEGTGQAARTAALVGVLIGLVLLQIVLLAGPAMAVGARRNQRMLAVVVSTGGERRHARRIVLAGALVVGLAASAVAAALGGAVGAATAAVLIWRGSMRAIAVDVPMAHLAGLAAVGGLTAVAAALIPARQAARLDVVAALTGRRGEAHIPRHVPAIGAAVAAAGVAVTLWGASRHSSLIVVVGIALSEIGLVATSGTAVALATRLSPRLPLPARFALRDAARNRGRTAPAVAAVMAAIAGAMAATLFVATQGDHDRRDYTPTAARGVITVEVDPSGGSRLSAADWARIEAAVRATLPVTGVAAIRGTGARQGDGLFNLQLVAPPGKACPAQTQPDLTDAQLAALHSDPRCAYAAGLPIQDVVDSTGAGVRILLGGLSDADAAALAAGKTVVGDRRQLWPDGTVHVVVGGDPSGTAPQRVLPAAAMTSDPPSTGVVIPDSALTRLGGVPVQRSVAARMSTVPTAQEEQRLIAALEDLALPYPPQVYVERGYVGSYAPGLLALLGAALVVCLVGTLTAVGLARAESRSDAATLAAVGANPGLRRRLAASQAGVVAGLGAALGAFGGLLAGYALVRMQNPSAVGQSLYSPDSQQEHLHLVVPWRYVLGLLLGVPAIAMGVAFVTTRSRLDLLRRPGL